MKRPAPPRLEVDLAFDADGDRQGVDGVRRIGFHVFAAAVKSPTKLAALLRGARCETVFVRIGEPPLSGAQAIVLAITGFVPARCWEVERQGRVYRRDRARFLAEALAMVPPAAARELWNTVELWRVIRAAALREHRLAQTVEHAVSALYLRVEPAVRWQGELVGGAATHTAGVANGLIANGVQVCLAAPEPLAGVDGAELLIVPPRRASYIVRGASYAAYSQAVVAAADGARASFVYQRHVLGGFAGLELARRLGVPLVLEFNGSEIWVEERWRSGRVYMRKSLAALERRNLLDASLIVVVSEALEDQLLASGIDGWRILVNPNGVDVERLAAHRDLTPSVWRERIGQPQVPTVGFIGTFGLWHGVELLPDLIEATPSARWIVVGAGDPLYARVCAELDARGLRDRVHMAGLVSRQRALELLSACDVCVSPHIPNIDGSRFFGSPTKLFEYMGLGKAIVASDLEQIGEVIEHERNGLLHPPNDTAAAAAAITRLLEDEALRARLGAAALKDAQELYSWTAHARRTLDALIARRPETSDNHLALEYEPV
jgi:glycosyltransferase involved in cell wall biosynthesis